MELKISLEPSYNLNLLLNARFAIINYLAWHIISVTDSVETLSYSKEKHISQILSENGKSRRLHQNVNEYL